MLNPQATKTIMTPERIPQATKIKLIESTTMILTPILISKMNNLVKRGRQTYFKSRRMRLLLTKLEESNQLRTQTFKFHLPTIEEIDEDSSEELYLLRKLEIVSRMFLLFYRTLKTPVKKEEVEVNTLNFQ